MKRVKSINDNIIKQRQYLPMSHTRQHVMSSQTKLRNFNEQHQQSHPYSLSNNSYNQRYDGFQGFLGAGITSEVQMIPPQ